MPVTLPSGVRAISRRMKEIETLREKIVDWEKRIHAARMGLQSLPRGRLLPKESHLRSQRKWALEGEIEYCLYRIRLSRERMESQFNKAC
jgi:hypothetical protein